MTLSTTQSYLPAPTAIAELLHRVSQKRPTFGLL